MPICVKQKRILPAWKNAVASVSVHAISNNNNFLLFCYFCYLYLYQLSIYFYLYRSKQFQEDAGTWKSSEDGKVISGQPTRVADERNGGGPIVTSYIAK